MEVLCSHSAVLCCSVASNHLETMYDIKSAPTSPNTAFPNPMAALSKGAPNYGNSLSAIDLFNVQASTQSTSASYLGQLDGDRIGCSTGSYLVLLCAVSYIIECGADHCVRIACAPFLSPLSG